MKKQALLTVATFCATVCCAQSNVVYYGASSNALNVVFVDTNLSVKAKSAIVADLRICLSSEWGKEGEQFFWNQQELLLRDKGDLRFGGKDSVGYLSFVKRSPHYPEDIKFPRNVVSNETVGIALQITKELSDAYTNAFAFAVANSNTVKAAHEFVAFVSSPAFANVAPADLPNYFLSKKVTPEEIIANAPELMDALKYSTYYPPSVLGFTKSPVGPAASNLWLDVPSSSTTRSGYKEWSGLPAVWHEGKWKFSFWMME